ncbi:hypothetical protein CL654_00725 [bacterium]|nr:hypothetical protein [bacterium]
MSCGAILPGDQAGSPLHGDEIVSCLLNGRGENHLTRLPDGRYVQWTFLSSCTECRPDDCSCFDYDFLSEDEAQELLERGHG